MTQLDDCSLEAFGYANSDQLTEKAIQPLYHFVVGVDSEVGSGVSSRYPYYNYEKNMAQFILDMLKEQQQQQREKKRRKRQDD